MQGEYRPLGAHVVRRRRLADDALHRNAAPT
jgi:hypothetical protein